MTMFAELDILVSAYTADDARKPEVRMFEQRVRTLQMDLLIRVVRIHLLWCYRMRGYDGPSFEDIES